MIKYKVTQKKGQALCFLKNLKIPNSYTDKNKESYIIKNTEISNSKNSDKKLLNSKNLHSSQNMIS